MKLINEHQFGNGAAIFTNNGAAAREFAYQVQAGMVGVNVLIPVPMAFHCFGGWKESAYGALNAYGPGRCSFLHQNENCNNTLARRVIFHHSIQHANPIN